ncbi:MAG: hypothetical protein LQ346_007172 [Caloplaca aetnensis]|nr:MAG: hypothetical protein LQ346_007172 [Caloplaca aetnensis]
MDSSSANIGETGRRFHRLFSPKGRRARRFRFLSLPRETRDQIYRELLCSEKVYRPAAGSGISRRYDYQVSLLRCNKQVRDEASPFLYQENCFITISIDWYATYERLKLPLRPSPGAVVSCYAALATRQLEPALDIKLRTNRRSSPGSVTQEKSNLFLVTPWELQLTLQLLCLSRDAPRFSSTWTCDLRFNLSATHSKYEGALIDGLLGIQSWLTRPVAITISGLDHPALSDLSDFASENGRLRFDDCFAHASTLEARGDSLLESGDLNNELLAYKYFYTGAAYVASLEGKRRFHKRITPEKLTSLQNKRLWLDLACSIYVMNNNPISPVAGFSFYRSELLSRLPVEVVAKSSLYLALVLMRHHKELQTIYYLRMALLACPGWPAAQRKVEELGRRILTDRAMKCRISKAFEAVLSSVYHQRCRTFTQSEWIQESRLRSKETKLAATVTRVEEFSWLSLWDYGDPVKGFLPHLSYTSIGGLLAMAELKAMTR